MPKPIDPKTAERDKAIAAIVLEKQQIGRQIAQRQARLGVLETQLSALVRETGRLTTDDTDGHGLGGGPATEAAVVTETPAQ